MQESVENIVFVGGTRVGKTQLAIRLTTKQKFSGSYNATTGVKLMCLSPTTSSQIINIWDTVGQKTVHMIDDYCSHGFIHYYLLFNPYDNDDVSFDDLTMYVRHIKQNSITPPKITLVATHSDVERRRHVTKEQVEAFVSENGILKYFEVSSMTGDGIKELETAIINQAESKTENEQPSAESEQPNVETEQLNVENEQLNTPSFYIGELKKWMSINQMITSPAYQATDLIVTILEYGLDIKNETNRKEYFINKKEILNDQLNILQKTSHIKTFQNACSAVLACVACFALVGFIPLYQNKKQHGDAFLFWTKGDKQQAEVAINMIKASITR